MRRAKPAVFMILGLAVLLLGGTWALPASDNIRTSRLPLFGPLPHHGWDGSGLHPALDLNQDERVSLTEALDFSYRFPCTGLHHHTSFKARLAEMHQYHDDIIRDGSLGIDEIRRYEDRLPSHKKASLYKCLHEYGVYSDEQYDALVRAPASGRLLTGGGSGGTSATVTAASTDTEKVLKELKKGFDETQADKEADEATEDATEMIGNTKDLLDNSLAAAKAFGWIGGEKADSTDRAKAMLDMIESISAFAPEPYSAAAMGLTGAVSSLLSAFGVLGSKEATVGEMTADQLKDVVEEAVKKAWKDMRESDIKAQCDKLDGQIRDALAHMLELLQCTAASSCFADFSLTEGGLASLQNHLEGTSSGLFSQFLKKADKDTLWATLNTIPDYIQLQLRALMGRMALLPVNNIQKGGRSDMPSQDDVKKANTAASKLLGFVGCYRKVTQHVTTLETHAKALFMRTPMQYPSAKGDSQLLNICSDKNAGLKYLAVPNATQSAFDLEKCECDKPVNGRSTYPHGKWSISGTSCTCKPCGSPSDCRRCTKASLSPPGQGGLHSLKPQPGDAATSQNALTLESGVKLVLQEDCNLVVYGPGSGDPVTSSDYAIWTSGTYLKGKNCHLDFQSDHNIVLYGDTGPTDVLWALNSQESGWRGESTGADLPKLCTDSCRLVLQQNCNLAVYASDDHTKTPVWQTGKTCSMPAEAAECCESNVCGAPSSDCDAVHATGNAASGGCHGVSEMLEKPLPAATKLMSNTYPGRPWGECQGQCQYPPRGDSPYFCQSGLKCLFRSPSDDVGHPDWGKMVDGQPAYPSEKPLSAFGCLDNPYHKPFPFLGQDGADICVQEKYCDPTFPNSYACKPLPGVGDSTKTGTAKGTDGDGSSRNMTMLPCSAPDALPWWSFPATTGSSGGLVQLALNITDCQTTCNALKILEASSSSADGCAGFLAMQKSSSPKDFDLMQKKLWYKLDEPTQSFVKSQAGAHPDLFAQHWNATQKKLVQTMFVWESNFDGKRWEAPHGKELWQRQDGSWKPKGPKEDLTGSPRHAEAICIFKPAVKTVKSTRGSCYSTKLQQEQGWRFFEKNEKGCRVGQSTLLKPGGYFQRKENDADWLRLFIKGSGFARQLYDALTISCFPEGNSLAPILVWTKPGSNPDPNSNHVGVCAPYQTALDIRTSMEAGTDCKYFGRCSNVYPEQGACDCASKKVYYIDGSSNKVWTGKTCTCRKCGGTSECSAPECQICGPALYDCDPSTSRDGQICYYENEACDCATKSSTYGQYCTCHKCGRSTDTECDDANGDDCKSCGGPNDSCSETYPAGGGDGCYSSQLTNSHKFEWDLVTVPTYGKTFDEFWKTHGASGKEADLAQNKDVYPYCNQLSFVSWLYPQCLCPSEQIVDVPYHFRKPDDVVAGLNPPCWQDLETRAKDLTKSVTMNWPTGDATAPEQAKESKECRCDSPGGSNNHNFFTCKDVKDDGGFSTVIGHCQGGHSCIVPQLDDDLQKADSWGFTCLKYSSDDKTCTFSDEHPPAICVDIGMRDSSKFEKDKFCGCETTGGGNGHNGFRCWEDSKPRADAALQYCNDAEQCMFRKAIKGMNICARLD